MAGRLRWEDLNDTETSLGYIMCSRPAWATEYVLSQPGLQNEDLPQNPQINKIMQTCWETWETQIKDTFSQTQSLGVVALPKLIHDDEIAHFFPHEIYDPEKNVYSRSSPGDFLTASTLLSALPFAVATKPFVRMLKRELLLLPRLALKCRFSWELGLQCTLPCMSWSMYYQCRNR